MQKDNKEEGLKDLARIMKILKIYIITVIAGSDTRLSEPIEDSFLFCEVLEKLLRVQRDFFMGWQGRINVDPLIAALSARF